jgi:hypothetical protein
VPGLTGLHILDFHPQRSSALLIFAKKNVCDDITPYGVMLHQSSTVRNRTMAVGPLSFGDARGPADQEYS